MLVVALGSMLMLSSCKKDENKTTPDTLVGTTWVAEGNYTESYGETGRSQDICKFTSDTAVSYSYIQYPDGTDEVYDFNYDYGAYVYDAPNITITLVYEIINENNRSDDEIYTGTISGNKMTLTTTYDNGKTKTLVFTRQ
jgi:hypothetical protein